MISRIRKSKKSAYVCTLLGVAITAALAGCSGTPSTATSGPGSGNTKNDITLTVWGMDYGPGYQTAIKGDLAEWAKIHPTVKIDWVTKSYSTIQASGKLALSGSGAPDIMQLVEGWADAQLVSAHLITDLTPYAKQYSWTKLLSPAAIALNSYTADGKTFGKGNLYSVSDSSTLIGYYYNKQLLRKLGLRVPTTMAQFTQELATAKQAGIIPIEQGNLEHTLLAFLAQGTPSAQLSDWVFGNGSGTIATPTQAANVKILQGWMQNGYFQPGYISESQNGVAHAAPINAFLSGKSLFYASADPTTYGTVSDAHQANNVGFFVQPPREDGGKLVTIGGANNPYAISSRSIHKAAAAQFLNFLLGKSAQLRIQPNAGFLPTNITVTSNSALPKTLLADSYATEYAKVKADGVVPWPDFSTPSFTTVAGALVVQLANGSATPSELLSQLEANHKQFLASNK